MNSYIIVIIVLAIALISQALILKIEDLENRIKELESVAFNK
jgi:hypothetical protein